MSGPFARRFWAYLQERYPPAQFVPFHLLLVAAVGGVVRARLGLAMEPEHLLAHGALAALLLLFFFVLRAMDEHKDHTADLAAYPERVLSRGLVTLGHLRRAGWAAAAGMVVLALPFGGPMVAGVGMLLGYALLMLREFGVGPWLRARLVLYGLSHNAVVLLALLVVALGFGLAAGGAAAALADPAVWTAALGLNGFVLSLEVARKVRLPEDERDGVDTYSRGLGVRRAALLVPALQAASLAALLPLPLGAGRWAVLAVAVLGVAVVVLRFVRRPTARGAERLVGPAAGGALLAFAALATLT